MGGSWVSASGFAVLMMAIFVQGCGDGSDVSCPEANRAFFDNSIKGHLERNPREGEVTDYKPQGDATYDSYNNWWSVPFVSGARKMIAILSCDGRVELSEQR